MAAFVDAKTSEDICKAIDDYKASKEKLAHELLSSRDRRSENKRFDLIKDTIMEKVQLACDMARLITCDKKSRLVLQTPETSEFFQMTRDIPRLIEIIESEDESPEAKENAKEKLKSRAQEVHDHFCPPDAEHPVYKPSEDPDFTPFVEVLPVHSTAKKNKTEEEGAKQRLHIPLRLLHTIDLSEEDNKSNLLLS